MDDKVFASANMTAAMSDDPAEYEAIPTVNVFDDHVGTTTEKRQLGAAGRVHLRALVLVPIIAAGYLLISQLSG